MGGWVVVAVAPAAADHSVADPTAVMMSLQPRLFQTPTCVIMKYRQIKRCAVVSAGICTVACHLVAAAACPALKPAHK